MIGTIKIEVDPGIKFTTAFIVTEDGIVHEPTYITVDDGRYYAEINSFETGTFGLFYVTPDFEDAMDTHWSREAVYDMASRLIVFGRENDEFDPDTSITRAEFTAIAVRSLGLTGDGIDNVPEYSDIDSGNWFYEYAVIGDYYGLIKGYDDGAFRPDQNITRQEAMAILSRMMTFIDFDTDTTNADELLAAFDDSADIAAWAEDAVLRNLAAQLIVGRDDGLALNEDITRAETATVVRRLLIASVLIDSRNYL